MSTILLYSYFLTSVVLLVLGATYVVRVSRGIPVLGANGEPTPKWIPIFVLCLGSLGVASSAPSIFTDNPHWFVDKLYFAVSKIEELFE